MIKQKYLLEILLSSDDVEAVATECNNFDRLYQEISDCGATCYCLSINEATGPAEEEVEENRAHAVWMEAIDAEYFAVKQKTCDWLHNKDTVRSIASKSSRRSSKSSARQSLKSHSSTLSLQQKAKIAGLKAEVEAVKRTKEAELNAELSLLQQKIKKAEVIGEVYAKESSEEEDCGQVRSK